MSYKSVHNRLHQQRGPASAQTCPCGKPARDWAYQHTGPTLRDPETQRPYSDNVLDYTAMCRSCHQLLDLKNQPEFAAVRLRVGTALTPARQAVYAQDPERAFAVLSAAGKLGISAAAPKLKEHRAMISTLNHTAKRRCLECGKVSVRTGLGRHQQVSGHQGYEDVA